MTATRPSLFERLATYPVVVLVYLIVLIPVVMVVLTSFTVQSSPTIPYDGITLEWYASLFADDSLMGALFVSTVIATCAAILSGVIGTIAAFGVVRTEMKYGETLATIHLLPLMISPVITGVAFLQYANQLNIPRGYAQIILAHSVIALPFVFLFVRSRLVTFDERLEDAARVMGATKLESVVNVTLPVIAPSMVAGMFTAFIISFGEFTATQFLTTPAVTTVPVIIYNDIQFGLSPDISALATVLVVIMIVLGALSELIE
ncbi:spermidine/putrescine transport system permease protein [Natronorubrum sediminis]|uniref:Spermidine/putrescine transport system permease protein n=1 Tax=Natronorubrum sediminis TaxID=640943 RepID=A0A1H6FUJ0_9EURY|nr:ABC transporter permease [Natronorubrum sediminis]SEH14457.1 spermidine/putrescine transport system permease protein [Natronorubrum sediminis]